MGAGGRGLGLSCLVGGASVRLLGANSQSVNKYLYSTAVVVDVCIVSCIPPLF